MFSILVNEDPKSDEVSSEYRWKAGEEKPYPNGRPFWLQATGEELEDIRLRFENIPITRRGYSDRCQWTGEIAAFILDNL